MHERSLPPSVCAVLSARLSAFTTMLTVVLAGHGRIPTENEEDDVQDIYIDQDEDEQGLVPGHDVQSLQMNQRGVPYSLATMLLLLLLVIMINC